MCIPQAGLGQGFDWGLLQSLPLKTASSISDRLKGQSNQYPASSFTRDPATRVIGPQPKAGTGPVALSSFPWKFNTPLLTGQGVVQLQTKLEKILENLYKSILRLSLASCI
jgi:hypothetical protein